MFENLSHHEFLFAIVLPIFLIAIYYYYLNIDYKFLFALSTYYYVMIPIIILPFSVYNTEVGTEAVQSMTARFLMQQYSIFLLFSICCAAFLFIGAKSFKQEKNTECFLLFSQTISFKCYNALFLLLGVYLFYNFQDNLFEGYQAENNWPRNRSWIIGITSISISMYAIVASEIEKNNFRNYFFNIYFIIALLFSSLYLTAGGRHLILMLITILFLELGKKRKSLFLVTFLSIILILFLGFAGALRAGYSDIYAFLNQTTTEIFSETNNVSNTMFSFIINENLDKYQLIAFPAPFLSQFFNLVPSIVFPGKIELMYSHQYVVHFQATSIIFIDILVNFGILGSFFIFWLIGYSMQYLKSISPGIFLAVSSTFALNLHRTFEITFIKNILQYSILIPLLIIATEKIFNYFRLKINK